MDLDQDINTLLASSEVLEKLEQCVMNWQTQITIALQEQEEKTPQVRNEPIKFPEGTGKGTTHSCSSYSFLLFLLSFFLSLSKHNTALSDIYWDIQ